MKRKAKKVEQKAWKWENMYPQFVSIVETGANFIPFSSIKFSADEIDSEYTEGYDIAKIVFNTNHTEQHAKQFLEEKNVVDYELKTDDAGKLYVDNPNLESFSDVKVITMQDGIEVHVGKTDKATVQAKTKIEEAEPVLKMSDEAEAEAVETVSLKDEIVDGVADEVVAKDEFTEGEEVVADEVTEENVTEEVTETENKFQDKKTVELLGEMISARMSDNEFTNYVDSRKTYLTMELLSYKLMDTVFYALQEEDRETKVLAVAAQFGEAVLKLYNALDTVNMSSDEDDEEDDDFEDEDLDQTGATIIGEEEPEVLLEASTTEADTITPAIEDLSSEVKALKAELEEIKRQKEVDSNNVLMQTSKADVGAFDKSPTLEDNKPSVYANNTKNLFGL